VADKEDQKAAADIGAKKFYKSEADPAVDSDTIPDTAAEVLDKEAEAKLKDKNTDPSEKPYLAGNILTTAEADHERDLESEQIRQNAQRKFAAEAAEAARKAATGGPDDWQDIRDPKAKK
jgi:hypothetical protein